MTEEQGIRRAVHARLVFSAGFTALSLWYLWSAAALEAGELARPGPGLYPVLIGAGAVLVGAFASISAFRALQATDSESASTHAPPTEEHEPPPAADPPPDAMATRQARRLRSIRFFAVTLCYPALINVVGFAVGSTLYLLVSARLLSEQLSRRRWVVLLVVVAVLPWAITRAFDALFEITFPRGVLWD